MPRIAGDASPPPQTFTQQYFESLYKENSDPWSFATSWYERRKYALTIASLPMERYSHGLELGCSIGELTHMLAPRCQQLLAVDCATRAVDQARRVVAEYGHVRVEQAALPHDLPDEHFDLIVASEILYYLDAEDFDLMLTGIVERLKPGGDIVAVHLRAADLRYGYDGYNVHQALTSHPELKGIVHHEDERFVLDVLRRR